MKDRMTGVAGEVELIRIENERFQESMGDSLDKTNLRLVELETQMQEQHLDVETAVQLERLEEVERALIALDPSQFVRKGETTGGAVAPTPIEDDALTSDADEAVQRALAAMDSAAGRAPIASPPSEAAPPATAPLSAPSPFSPPVNAQR